MRRAPVVVMGLALVIALDGPSPVEAVPADLGQPAPLSVAQSTYAVTLITGDTVDLQKQPGGRQVVGVRPGAGRERMRFHQLETDGELRVIPEDAVPHIASKRLDDGLFNVTELIAAGYDDARRSTVPLIVSQTETGTRLAAASTELDSIDASAITVDKGTAFWSGLDDEQEMRASGVRQIQLDRPVRAALDKSVPQIGAPKAWQAGYDGRGVTVAVLDTGVDPDHPDLAGTVVEARDFSDSPDARDHFGHGTHVASTMLGRGVAAGRKGVAPGARLLSGKVLDDAGFGSESSIIDGMEWAAEAGAKVVNLSLGGDATDGTDPMSRAVNQLTAEHGTLFVISAGNEGADLSVGTPGAAASALTVGAVDRAGALASFSSRGPRLGDFGIKPDITAPGVDIVAARAAGTSMGGVVDEHHTTASGTSMAAPHVAGAAAILAQQHPDWTATELKDALASTAVRNDTLTVYQQGGGRVDLARAIDQAVTGTGTLDLGVYQHDQTGVARKPVTYRNTSAAPVTLDLKLDLGPGITLAQPSVVVPANGSATVDVLVDAGTLSRGRRAGYLTATAGSTVVHTSVGAQKESRKHKVTLSAVGRDGGQAFVSLVTLFGEDSRFDVLGYLPEGATRTVEVAEGTYYLQALIPAGEAPDGELAQIVDPVLRVDRDQAAVLDARKANRVVIQTPKPAQQRGIFMFYARREFPGRSITNSVMDFDGTRYLAVTPTRKVTGGRFEFGSRWSLVAPMLSSSVVGRDFQPELMYLHYSPTLDGRRRLSLVDVGAGRPEDYQGRDVRGRVAFAHGGTLDQEQLVRNGAAAGAAMVLIVPRQDEYAWTVWQPIGERLPTLGAILRHAEGARLLDLLRRGPVRLDLHGVPISPYLYDVLQVTEQQIPARIVHRVSDRNSATVTTDYHENGGDPFAKEQRFGWRPWQTTANLQYQRWMATGQTRQEIVSAGEIEWQHRVKHLYSWDAMNPLTGGMTTAPIRYRPGQRVRESWFGPVVRPAIPSRVAGLASYREGDTMTLRVPPFVDQETGHYGLAEGGFGEEQDAGKVRLYRDGTLVAEGDWAWGTATVPPGPAAYRLEVDVARESAQWEFGTHTNTAWTFRSTSGSGKTLLPMLQVDYDIETDLRNHARAGRIQLLRLGLRHQDGLPRVHHGTVRVWTSYDDGRSWQRAAVLGHGNRFAALYRNPAGGHVSLKVEASDGQGNTITQIVRRAYGVSR